MQIQSIVQRGTHPASFVSHLAHMVDTSAATGTIQFEIANNEQYTGYNNAAYFSGSAALSLQDMDPTCVMAQGQLLAETERPTSRVGYASTRSELVYAQALAAEFGTWYREFLTLHRGATEAQRDSALIRDDALVENMLGYEEMFLLACGDLTQAPFNMMATEDPNIDKILAIFAEEAISTGIIDHEMFEIGFKSSRVGMTAFPGTGERVMTLDSESVTALYTHPWKAVLRNPVIRDKFQPFWQARAPSVVGHWGLSEGGSTTFFTSSNWADEIAIADAADSTNVIAFEDTNIIGNDAGRYATSQYLNDADWFLSILDPQDTTVTAASMNLVTNGQRHSTATAGIRDLAVTAPVAPGDEQFVSGCNAYEHVPRQLRLHTCAAATAVQWVEILRRLKQIMPITGQIIMSQGGRAKTKLPGPGAVDMIGPKTFGHLYANSMNDGYIMGSVPGFNAISKMEYDAMNGPMVVDSRMGGPTRMTPYFVDGINRWGGADYSNACSYQSLVGVGYGQVTLPNKLIGEHASGRHWSWSSPGITEGDLYGASVTQKVREQILSYPLAYSGSRWAVEDFSLTSAYGGSSNSGSYGNATATTQSGVNSTHVHPGVGFVRGMVRQGNTLIWFHNPNRIPIHGAGWQTWAGSFMPARAWVDPYRSRPFAVSTALLMPNEIDALPDVAITGLGTPGTSHPALTQVIPTNAANENWTLNLGYNRTGLQSMHVTPTGGMPEWLSLSWIPGTELSFHTLRGTLSSNAGDGEAGGDNATDMLSVYATGGQSTTSYLHNFTVQNPHQRFHSPLSHINNSQDGVGTWTQPGGSLVGGVTKYGMGTLATGWWPGIVADVQAINGRVDGYFINAQGERVRAVEPQLQGELLIQAGGDAAFSNMPMTMVTGNYMIQPATNPISRATCSPASWFVSTYLNGSTDLDNDFSAFDFALDGAGEAYGVGATFVRDTGLIPLTATGVDPAINNWIINRIPDTVSVHRRRSLLRNPWVKADAQDIGYISTTYEPSEFRFVDRSLRDGLKAWYRGTMAKGLTDSLFRELQVIN
jgi:hypothetical protein